VTAEPGEGGRSAAGEQRAAQIAKRTRLRPRRDALRAPVERRARQSSEMLNFFMRGAQRKVCAKAEQIVRLRLGTLA
jgi:hypothetical protein